MQPLGLEIVAQPRLVIGHIRAFDDLAGRGDQPAAKFHALVYRFQALVEGPVYRLGLSTAETRIFATYACVSAYGGMPPNRLTAPSPAL